MKTSTKIAIGAAILLGIGFAASRTASAEESPDAGKGLVDSGVRHGIRYEGCQHFELADFQQLEAWVLDNKWAFAKWALRLDELRENPEPALVENMTKLFPECPWPPPPATTFGPERVSWAAAIATTKEQLASVDFAERRRPTNRLQNLERELASALAFMLRKRIK